MAIVGVRPALGNHDYACFLGFWPCSNKVHPTVRDQFPFVVNSEQRLGYSMIKGDVAFVFLDSAGGESLKKQMARLLSNRDVAAARVLLLFVHHAPFSYSRWLGPNKTVQKDVAKAAIDDPRIIAVFSGHAHGYERFLRTSEHHSRSTMFIVTGGGGGPRRKYHINNDDEYNRGSCKDKRDKQGKRPFNFVVLKHTGISIQGEVIGMCKPGNRQRRLK